MIPPKETNKALITVLKEKAIYQHSYKGFRIVLLKFSELQEHSDRQLNKIRKVMHEQTSSTKQ